MKTNGINRYPGPADRPLADPRSGSDDWTKCGARCSWTPTAGAAATAAADGVVDDLKRSAHIPANSSDGARTGQQKPMATPSTAESKVHSVQATPTSRERNQYPWTDVYLADVRLSIELSSEIVYRWQPAWMLITILIICMSHKSVQEYNENVEMCFSSHSTFVILFTKVQYFP